MKHLLIIGARGWGRDVYAAALGTKAYKDKEFDIKGFLDSKADAFDGLRGNYPPIICAPEDYEIQKDDVFFVAMGDPHWRKHYADLIEAKGGKFITIISPNAYINPTATICEGCFVSRNTVISDNVYLGKHVMVHGLCILGHDAKVGDYASLSAYVFLGGYSEVGELSSMNPKAMIIPHKKIGKEVVVGAGSVVMRNVVDGLHVHGNPAVKVEI